MKKMRLYLKRMMLCILVMVLIQLAVYFEIISLRHKARSPARFQERQKPRSSAGQLGTCDDDKDVVKKGKFLVVTVLDLMKPSSKVKEGMLNVHLIPHSHLDVGWLKTVDQYYTGDNPEFKKGQIPRKEVKECVSCIFNSVIQELQKNPDRRFIIIEMAFFSRYWLEVNNITRATIKTLIDRGQLVIVMGGWVMSDAAVTYYNDIIDQLTLGFDFLEHNLGSYILSPVAWHVDQFGHSREHAAIFAKMGFDGLFIGRIDFQDHNERKKTKTLEFVWETSISADEHSANLFTHVTYDGYYAPPGFVLDKDIFFIQDQNGGTIGEFIRIVKQRANAFRTQHLLLPMGSDFGYRNASKWFTNMDNIIRLINEEQTAKWNVNVFYSTPSCYLHHVHKANLAWAVKTADFHPYGISPGAYWTGYFTSRPGQKLLVKKAGAMLQACKQLGIFARLNDSYHRTNVLRQAVAVMQHHDAITGTEKQSVSDDYNRLLSEGMTQCQSVISEAYSKLLQLKSQAVAFNWTFCPELNISQCSVTENSQQVLVLVYNPLSRPVSTWLRLPVTSYNAKVQDSRGEAIESQLLFVPEGVIRLPERTSESDSEVTFCAKLPAMGYTSFVLISSAGSDKTIKTNPEKKDLVLQNKYLKVTFDRKSGRLKGLSNLSSGRKIQLWHDMAYYNSAQGPLVQEVHQQFNSWVYQVIRLYKDSPYLELQWTVGPIPEIPRKGKEIVSYFVTNIDSGGKFYTDSNGREILERKLNQRETWNLTVIDAISSNYYPVTSRIYIQDKVQDVQLTILPDRPQGGSSLYEGTLELMVHRQMFYDDGLGIGEPLNERGKDGDGVIYTGKHLLFLDTIYNSAVLTRQMAMQVHFPPTLTFLPLTSNSMTDKVSTLDVQRSLPQQKSFLNEALPFNVQILSLDYCATNHSSIYLLRLEHIYEKAEGPVISDTVSVQIQKLFSPLEVTDVEEVSLGGNFSPASHKLQWTTIRQHTNGYSVGSPDYKEVMKEPFTVKLRPMEIRTFRIYITDS